MVLLVSISVSISVIVTIPSTVSSVVIITTISGSIISRISIVSSIIIVSSTRAASASASAATSGMSASSIRCRSSASQWSTGDLSFVSPWCFIVRSVSGRKVCSNGFSMKSQAIGGIFGFCGIFLIFEVNESKASRLTSSFVHNERNLLELPVFSKFFF